ncbi:DUF3987 domain-containing protein [Bacillus cabrialesii subsp. cabrialesii]
MNTVSKISVEEWGQPILFDNDNLPLFPTEIFPDWLKDYVEAVAEETQTPRDTAAILALSILSTALSGKFKVNPVGNWIEPLNLYTLVILPPANRKSAVFELMKRPIIKFEKEERERKQPEINKNKVTRNSLTRRKNQLEQQFMKTSDETLLNEIESIEEKLGENLQLTLPRVVVDDVTQERLVGLLKENDGKISILSAEGGIFEIIGGRYTNSGKANLTFF